VERQPRSCYSISSRRQQGKTSIQSGGEKLLEAPRAGNPPQSKSCKLANGGAKRAAGMVAQSRSPSSRIAKTMSRLSRPAGDCEAI
jgi:hypothetical protein